MICSINFEPDVNDGHENEALSLEFDLTMPIDICCSIDYQSRRRRRCYALDAFLSLTC